MSFCSANRPHKELKSLEGEEFSVPHGKVDGLSEARGNSPVAHAFFSHRLHEVGPSRVIPLDVGGRLDGPVSVATGLSLCFNFVRIRRGEPIATHANATAELFYVLRGVGRTRAGGVSINWQTGDLLSLPAGDSSVHAAEEDTVFFWVHDEPLLNALETRGERSQCEPMLFRTDERIAARTENWSDSDPHSEPGPWNPLSVLTASLARDRSVKRTGTLGTMFDALPRGRSRRPQLTRSVTLNLILDCQPGCYTLIGKAVDKDGQIIEPRRVDWEPASAIVYPPGSWLAHVNESKSESHLMVFRVADLQSSLCTLDLDAGSQGTGGTLNLASQRGRRNE